MPYVPLDDQFHSHRKVIRLLDTLGTREGLESIGMHTLGLSWAGQAFTNGHVPNAVDERHAPKRGARLRDNLLSVGLRDDCDDDHERCSVIHDWGSVNDPADELKAAREKERDRKRKWRSDRRASRDGDGTGDGTNEGQRDGTDG